MFSQMKNYLFLRVLLCLLMGILIFMYPTAVLKWLLYVIAGYFVVTGAVEIIAYFRVERGTGFFCFDFIGGILLMLLGIVIASHPVEIASLIHIFMGILVVIGGANAFIQSRRVNAAAPGTAGMMTGYALAVMAVGVFIVFNPFTTQVVLYRFFAGVLMIMGISDLVWYFRFRNALKG